MHRDTERTSGERKALDAREKILVGAALQSMPRDGNVMCEDDVTLAAMIQEEFRRKGMPIEVTYANVRLVRKALGYAGKRQRPKPEAYSESLVKARAAYQARRAEERARKGLTEPPRSHRRVVQGGARPLHGFAPRVKPGSKWGIGGLPKVTQWLDERLMQVEKALRDLGANVPVILKPADVLTRFASDGVTEEKSTSRGGAA